MNELRSPNAVAPCRSTRMTIGGRSARAALRTHQWKTRVRSAFPQSGLHRGFGSLCHGATPLRKWVNGVAHVPQLCREVESASPTTSRHQANTGSLLLAITRTRPTGTSWFGAQLEAKGVPSNHHSWCGTTQRMKAAPESAAHRSAAGVR